MLKNDVFLARNYYDRGNAKRALEIIENAEIAPENRDDIEGSLLYVNVLCSLNQFDSAKNIIEILLSKFPDNTEVIDGAIHFFSLQRSTAGSAKELCKERIKMAPDNNWYYYILSYVCFYYLDSDEEEVLGYLCKSLELCNYTLNLDHAYNVFDYYKSYDRRDHCLEQLMELHPGSSFTRAKLFHNLFHKEKFREAAEVALEFFKDFPDSHEISTYQLTSLKKLLRLNRRQKEFEDIKVKLIEHYDVRVYSNSLVDRIILGIPLRLFYYLLLPYLFPGMISSKNHLHLAAFKRDELYRRLCSARDNVIFEDQKILLYCPDSKTDVKVILFEEDSVYTGSDLTCSLKEAVKGFDKIKFTNSKVYNARSIKGFSAKKSTFDLETTWSISGIEYSSPDTVVEVEKHLKSLNWVNNNNIAWDIISSLFVIKFFLYLAGFGAGHVFRYSNSLVLASYVGGIPLFYLVIYLRSLFFSSRRYSYRPKTSRFLKK
ncbi:MAG TPA: tetratricopeptide repeat protein [Oligoflexia bacterium]|nr:tetratricopeptide repeat protein [Oligoflexia bacterium]HMP48214.1 tetratricopeptide repeat protein [Oligoflexia bacterium]